MLDPRRVIADYWAAADARDWAAFGSLLADDLVYEVPQTRERIRGRATYVRFNADYPGDWHIVVQRVIASDGEAVSWIDFIAGGTAQIGITFFRLDVSGSICSISDFWPEPYTPPPGREHLVESY